MRTQKHILVSITYRGVLHWRLIAAYPDGKKWKIPGAAFVQFMADIGRTPTNCRCGRCGGGQITIA